MACPNQISSLSLVAGGPTAHITIVRTDTCAQVGPGGVTWGGANHVTLTADATGFVVTPGLTAGSDSIVFNSSGATQASVSVTVAAPFALGVTSP